MQILLISRGLNANIVNWAKDWIQILLMGKGLKPSVEGKQ